MEKRNKLFDTMVSEQCVLGDSWKLCAIRNDELGMTVAGRLAYVPVMTFLLLMHFTTTSECSSSFQTGGGGGGGGNRCPSHTPM